jgi:hypothetical protein
MISHGVNHEEPDPEEILQFILPMFGTIALLSLTSIGLLVFYIIHVVRHKAIDGNERIVWIILFVFAGMIAFPIYYFMRVLKADTTA